MSSVSWNHVIYIMLSAFKDSLICSYLPMKLACFKELRAHHDNENEGNSSNRKRNYAIN